MWVWGESVTRSSSCSCESEFMHTSQSFGWSVHLNLLAMHTYVSLRTHVTAYTHVVHTYTHTYIHTRLTPCINMWVLRADVTAYTHAHTLHTHWHMCPCFDNSTISDAVLSIEIVFCACTAFEVHNSQVCTFAKTPSDVSRLQPKEPVILFSLIKALS